MPTKQPPSGAKPGGEEEDGAAPLLFDVPPELVEHMKARGFVPGFGSGAAPTESPTDETAKHAADGGGTDAAAPPVAKQRARQPAKRAPAKKRAPAATGTTKAPAAKAAPAAAPPTPANNGREVAQLQGAEEARAGVPARYDDGAAWLAAGLRRHRLASFLALIFGWTGFWLALWGAVLGGIIGILVGLGVITSTSVTSHLFNMGAGQAVTFVGVLTGGVLGIVGGFLYVLKLLFFDRPLQAVFAIISGAVVSVVLVVVSACFERLSLRVRGYRRLSRDEVRQIAPLVKNVADAMDLPALPRFAMHDVVIPNAWTHMRTVVITKGLLQSLDDGEISAILAHELQHWQSGDSVGLHFVWAAAFPAVLMFNFGTWLAGSWPDVSGGKIGKAVRTVLGFVGWLLAWPSWVLIKLVLVPVVSSSQRGYEFEADAAAARIGLGSQLISALQKLSAFEQGRTGWEAALAATHPPSELRIEALQQPRPDDWEYQEEEFGPPTWTEVRRIFGGLREVGKR